MDYDQYEQDTEEKIKHWWDENGKTVIAAVVVGVAGIFGWDQFQKNETATNEAISTQFQNLVEEQLTLTDDATEAERSQVFELAAKLQSEQTGSSYAVYADLMMAKLAVDNKDYGLAQTHLESAKSSATTDELAQIATLRLAQVLKAQEKYDDALAVLPQNQSGAFSARAFEIRADILLVQGDVVAARAAYDSAIAQAGMSGLPIDLLQLKRNNLNEVAKANVTEESSEAVN